MRIGVADKHDGRLAAVTAGAARATRSEGGVIGAEVVLEEVRPHEGLAIVSEADVKETGLISAAANCGGCVGCERGAGQRWRLVLLPLITKGSGNLSAYVQHGGLALHGAVGVALLGTAAAGVDGAAGQEDRGGLMAVLAPGREAGHMAPHGLVDRRSGQRREGVRRRCPR